MEQHGSSWWIVYNVIGLLAGFVWYGILKGERSND